MPPKPSAKKSSEKALEEEMQRLLQDDPRSLMLSGVDCEGTAHHWFIRGTKLEKKHIDSLAAGSSLASITLPVGLTMIGPHVFLNCASLKEITLPAGLRVIAGFAFAGCISLKKIDLPETVFVIAPYAFDGCTALKEIDLPASVSLIADYVFRKCTALEEINIPRTINSLEEGAFEECSSLHTVTFEPASEAPVTPHIRRHQLKSIGESCFRKCTALRHILLPPTVRSIRRRAFMHTALVVVKLPVRVTEVREEAFAHCTNLAAVVFPPGTQLRIIEDAAFASCGLVRINIPKSVQTIGAGAFKNCTNLSGITFAEDGELTTIGLEAFFNTAVRRILIGQAVTHVGQRAFPTAEAVYFRGYRSYESICTLCGLDDITAARQGGGLAWQNRLPFGLHVGLVVCDTRSALRPGGGRANNLHANVFPNVDPRHYGILAGYREVGRILRELGIGGQPDITEATGWGGVVRTPRGIADFPAVQAALPDVAFWNVLNMRPAADWFT